MSLLQTKYADHFYIIFRIGIGLLFFLYGIQKLFMLWGMPVPAPFGSLIWFAGITELLIGLGLMTGVLTRLASLFGAIEMIVAYLIGVVPMGGWNPMVNQGQPAIFFFLAFLVTLAYGAKKASIERAILKRELF